MAIQEEITTGAETSAITLSDRAASELSTMLIENDRPNAYLRVYVAGGGCSGLQYGMALDENEPEEEDRVFTDKGVRIVIDINSLYYMTGSVVDYVDDQLGGGFKIENPNAVKSCGCGSSFSTGEEGMEGLDTGGRSCGGCGCH